MAHEHLTLPTSIIGPSDLSRLIRDLEQLDEQTAVARVRTKAGVANDDPVRPGRSLHDVATANEYDLNKADQRQTLLEQLRAALTDAPTVTLSFAVDPSAVFMAKIITWLREATHPQVLVRVGLQPNIAAGFTLRTPSKVYDFSLRSKFSDNRDMLISRLHQPAATSAVETPDE